MYYKSAGLLFLLFLCISCADTSHNILPATSSENGILVVPHSAKGQHQAADFPYGSYSIEEIVIFPNSTPKQLLLTKGWLEEPLFLCISQ